MIGSLRLLFAPLLMGAMLALGLPLAEASKANSPPGAAGVVDGAKMFSKEAVTKAEKKIDSLRRSHNRGLFIETMGTPPTAWEKKIKSDRKKGFSELSVERAKDQGVRGVYVLICKEPAFVQIAVGNVTRDAGFTTSHRGELRDAITTQLKKGPKNFDDALYAAVDTVESAFKSMSPAPAAKAPVAARNADEGHDGSGSSGIWGWVILIVLIVLGVWLVTGLIRAFSGGGGGGAGGGGGGGGFWTSMLGGLFGAAAGMYLYDTFFRSDGMNSAQASSPTTTDDGVTAGQDGDDWGGADADDRAGGDWGGDDGGGDWGGGGDW